MVDNDNLTDIVKHWLAAFEKALVEGDRSELEALFLGESYWRDQVALTWDMRQAHGRQQVVDGLLEVQSWTRPSAFSISDILPAPTEVSLLNHQVIEAYIVFKVHHGQGQGLLRLVRDESSRIGSRCFLLGTDILSLNSVSETLGNRVTRERTAPVFPLHGYTPKRQGQYFSEHRVEKKLFENNDPDVLIIGAGHSGMSVGARLDRMGQSYLIIDRGSRLGDSWRNRYESLALHTIGAVNNLPYLKSPEIFPDYVAKNLWADWLEAYGRMMSLNIWLQTDAVSGAFDEGSGRWNICIKQADGSSRVMHPKHIVWATGGIGLNPKPFNAPGLETFKGKVIHSKFYRSGSEFEGQNVLVVGSGTSSFDMCYDLYLRGAKPTMLQRSETSVVPLEEGVRYNRDYLPGGQSLEISDLRRGAGAVYPIIIEILKKETTACNERNAELFAKLRDRGLWIGDGDDGSGWLGKLFKSFKGFHLNMGVLEEIVDGNVQIQQMSEVECFVENGIRLKDGTVKQFDTVVAATGFMNSNEDVAEVFGDEVAARVGPCSGLDETGEPMGLAKPLKQRQFWQVYGGINDCRRLSRHIALQIIAQLKGYVPPLKRSDDGGLTKL
ncbi:flavin-containing monooxygenase [Pseudomonas fluorescens]|uniref:Ferredoxin--NADP reductase n=1 Tax=Pseudomonas fluorescens TaxID=294 RepID=A0A5E7D6F9_PSEFL|nr:NAD(P)/FAD-dependent oxidoreductase [Pseudomonas fluorescens]VVO03504.1 Ferredoxin--NADP reductase [Pseudomonas fluorescens]